ncbi:Alpha-1,2-mannosyltransferase [Wickerhamomyces ciferrii]|uniref:Mannosyltransferase n=1 Tax=Wickerhamomyces ciferrii (strain ATCC 14091 / BCRC 22168 / CBS 111 / JCM 3599 / NBRC 0793 / NRRL Y-1031 F-60-10) TaxID=1206466 RepID=K0KL53_WICCF|nr:Alpha-1,2-mannosyltransferase [Wickerhamomyces ciferrii]CCH41828.1 Alpha-1,2-mannosyltransferase [Wickerhamomyces ciferrii]
MPLVDTKNPLVHLLLLIRLICVFYSIIPDCDEVFNYYEPLNFLLRGFGKQTWEYSPEYAIRSWAYLIPYAIPTYPVTVAIDYFKILPPQAAFYTIRLSVVSFTLYSELHLYNTLKQKVNLSIANYYLFFTSVSTGLSHASIALLPSSFAMNCTALATSNLIQYFHSRNLGYALLVTFWFITGGVIGWPFVLALAAVSTLVIIAQNLKSFLITRRYIGWSFFIVLVIIGTSLQIDSTFYAKTVLVPANIVLYNVIFADENAGPNIFGVEPLSYYIINLLLNFNIIAILGYIGIIAVPVLSFTGLKPNKLSNLEIITILSPIAVWSGIFFSQPHKEERFLYPIYSTINLSAAFTLWYVSKTISCITQSITKSSKSSSIFKSIIVSTILILTFIISLSKTASLSNNYSAPLEIYNSLPRNESGNVCVGREWYRYPSSFFLSQNQRLNFIKTNFNGLLPGDFNETIGKFQSIRIIPENMNNLNKFEPSKLSNFENCDYAIDISQPVDSETEEIGFLNEQGEIRKGWELIKSVPFLNNDESEGIGRLLWIPKQFFQLTKTKLTYHSYNLYKKVE